MRKILIIIASATSLIACRKNDHTEDAIPVNSAAKFKTITYGADVTTYTYDNYGRQLLSANSDGSRIESVYSTGKVTQRIFNTGGVLSRTITIELSSDGLIKKETFSDKPSSYTLYEYSADKKVTQSVSFNGTDTYVSTRFFKGDQLDSIRYARNNNWYLTNVFTYYPGKENMLAPANNGVVYFSNEEKLIMKSLTHVNSNGTIIQEDYVYEYDALGRVVKLTETTPSGTSTGYYTY